MALEFEDNQTARGLIRAGATGFSILFLIIACWTVWILFTKVQAVDFLSYWAASRLVLSGHPQSAYNLYAHQAAEMAIAPISGILPFAYPPPFLLIVSPFGLLPFWLSFAAWVAITASIYVLVFRPQRALPYATAHPSVLSNLLIGQNGFLTASIFAGGLSLVATNPFAGGAVLGLLVIKPQLALAIPFAMIAGRQWKAIAGGALSSGIALLAGYLVFGWKSYEGFAHMVTFFAHGIEHNRWPWAGLASVFASLRFLGVPQTPALIVQMLFAVAAIGLTCRAWWLDLPTKGPMLATAALLTSPYLFTYDALLLVIPLLWMIRERKPVWIIMACWLLCLLPIAAYLNVYPGPNTVSLAATLCLWGLHAPVRGTKPSVVTRYA